MNRIIIITFIILSNVSCKREISEKQFEQNVFDQIFLETVNSTYKDKRLYTFFPLPGMSGDNQEFEKQRQILAKDTFDLVIAVEENRLIEFDKFKNQKFIFKNLAELPKSTDYENWSKKYKKFAGVMSFSKIQFDAKKEKGNLSVTYTCGGKCGLGFTVYIKKENDKWVIVKVHQDWIS